MSAVSYVSMCTIEVSFSNALFSNAIPVINMLRILFFANEEK